MIKCRGQTKMKNVVKGAQMTPKVTLCAMHCRQSDTVTREGLALPTLEDTITNNQTKLEKGWSVQNAQHLPELI